MITRILWVVMSHYGRKNDATHLIPLSIPQ